MHWSIPPSPHLPTPPHTSPHLPTPPHTTPHLPTSPQGARAGLASSLMRRRTREAEQGRSRRLDPSPNLLGTFPLQDPVIQIANHVCLQVPLLCDLRSRAAPAAAARSISSLASLLLCCRRRPAALECPSLNGGECSLTRLCLQGETKPRIKNIFTLDTCSAISGAQALEIARDCRRDCPRSGAQALEIARDCPRDCPRLPTRLPTRLPERPGPAISGGMARLDFGSTSARPRPGLGQASARPRPDLGISPGRRPPPPPP